MSPDVAAQSRPTSLQAWVSEQVSQGARPVEIVASCAVALAERLGLDSNAGPPIFRAAVGCEPPSDSELSPWSLGVVYEQALEGAHRHTHGIHYTPRDVATRLARIALEGRDVGECDVVDPAVGGGAFLLGAAEVLAERGLERRAIVSEMLWGIDIDADAVQVAIAALALWGSSPARGWVSPGDHIVQADALVHGLAAFEARTKGFDTVLGNPPFQGQLGAGTARSAGYGRELRERWAADAGPYADTAAFFLLAGLELSASSGRIVLVQPQSVLGAADAAPIRAVLDERAVLSGLWIGGAEVFDASVRVCAPVLDRGADPTPIRRWAGPAVEPIADSRRSPTPLSWSPLIADLLGAPTLRLPSGPTLDECASATAGFRDEFYGLAKHTIEGGAAPPERLPLVTVGMIDPLRSRWGSGKFRFNSRSWTAPTLDMAALRDENPRLARWVEQRRLPKLLVATQTKVIEVVARPSRRPRGLYARRRGCSGPRALVACGGRVELASACSGGPGTSGRHGNVG